MDDEAQATGSGQSVAPPSEAELDRIAWRVVSDLLKPASEFGRHSPEALQNLIGLRLFEEAARSRLRPEDLALAFDRAVRELTGVDRPPRDASNVPDDARDDEGSNGGSDEGHEGKGMVT